MMNRLGAPATSIRRRAMLVVMTTTLVALLLSAGALLMYELHSHRKNWAQDLQTQADLVAQASVPALGFDDPRVARENLALLRLRPQIEAAAIYDSSGRSFADYVAPGQPALPPTLVDAAPGPSFHRQTLELRQPIVQQGENLGTVVVRAHYDVLARLLDYIAILGTVTLASLGLSALVAGRLQSTITDPIVAVSNVAREVMEQRNYALRAPKVNQDEVGTLVDAFNDMLQELGGQAQALQAADRRKDEFLATLAHELRNPLAPVSTSLAILERGDVNSATQTRLVGVMQRQVRQLVRLIDDLMEVSRISTGRMTLRPERLDLCEVVRAAVESVLPSLLKHGHQLAVQWPEPVWVEADRTRLGQVFANLLGNAVKYTDPGGRIEIAFALTPEAVAVSVSDNGIGIAPAMQAEVFEMFVQVDRSLSRGRAGLGVGLSLARQLATLQGGSLTLHSAGLGRGATFTVQLPRQAGPLLSGPTVASPSPVPATRALHVLLADDNHDFADSLALALRQAGHQVRVVHDGLAALRVARSELLDVGLFDIGMPAMDGYALATALRRSESPSSGCLLVAITGWGQQADQQRASAAGFDHHLVKPVDLEVLLRLLATRMPQRR
jgi:signal transduction histidine kinase/CheY-like chemotaxis protein